MRDVLGTSTGIMDCNQSEEAEMEEEGLLRITPVWNVMENKIMELLQKL